ncbi:MAG: hypothetical protein FWD53_07045 [Phycisphaerales bacterium]|nr:hypothetical protein [Phycisphaerales bacterium]
MREETFAQQLPHLLTKELSPTAIKEWGIGLSYMNDEKTAIGHGAASLSTFHFYPSQNLVVTMTRNNAGKNFDKYHP